MTTVTLKVTTIERSFVDKCRIRHDDDNGITKITITDTVSTTVQAAYDELEAESTVSDLYIFNSGTFGTANYIQSGKAILSAELKSIQRKNQTDSYILEFTIQ